MADKHDTLIDDAEEAIIAVFSNPSVSQSEKKRSLTDLKGFIVTLVDSLE